MDARGEDALAPARIALGAAGALPWALPLARSWLPLGRAGELLDASFALLCHRIPERTLVLAGVPMPLCSRCAGIFAGLALGGLIARPRLPAGRWRVILAVVTAVMIFDVIAQAAGLHGIWHPIRLATGAAFGYAAAMTLLASLGGAYFLPPMARHS